MSSPASPRDEFLRLLAAAWQTNDWQRLTLGKPRGTDPTLRQVYVRPVRLGDAAHCQFLWRHDTRDLTKNHLPPAARQEVDALLGSVFHSAHLFTSARTIQLEFNKKGEPRLTFGKADTPPAAAPSHDHANPRRLPPDSQRWLQALGVTTAAGHPREGMADKHRQIHKFVELLSHLVADVNFPSIPSDGGAQSCCALAGTPPWEGRSETAPRPAPAEGLPNRSLEIVDMGCGKGYLTFALHDYFNLVAGRPARVLGVESRPALVELCQRTATATGRDRLHFIAGHIGEVTLGPLDVLIALHACDTATDDAIARGIAAGAGLIVVSPCCQKELRPQLRAAPVLAPALRHGILAERHAEFATDALRALLLEWAGYDTKVFEFISTEHTAKNLMIAARKRIQPDSADRREQHAQAVRDLAGFYGIRTQALARQLGFSLEAAYLPVLPP